MIDGIPENIEELKRMANNKCSWRERLEAINVLKDYNCQQSKDIVTRLALHDPVYKVKEAAFRVSQAFSVKDGKKPIYLGRKKKGTLVTDISKKLAKVRDSLGSEYNLEEFKEKFSKLYPEAYDIYEGDLDNRFDKWLSNALTSLPKKK